MSGRQYAGRGRQESEKDVLVHIRSEVCKLASNTNAGALPLNAATATNQVTQTSVLNNINSVLNSIYNNNLLTQDIEILLVRDTGNNDLVVQQIREYDQASGTWSVSYEDVNGNSYSLVGAAEYLDPSSVLNLILSALNGTLDIDIVSNTAGIATETTLSNIDAIISDLNSKFNTLGQKISSESVPVVLSSEQESILDDILTDTTEISSELAIRGQQSNVDSRPVTLSTEQEQLLSDIETAVSSLDTSTLATETTLTAVRTILDSINAVINNIKTDTAFLDIELSKVAREDTLQDIESLIVSLDNKLNSLGQKVSADSMPVVLSTENESLLSDMDAKLGDIASNTSTSFNPVQHTTFGGGGNIVGAGTIPAGFKTVIIKRVSGSITVDGHMTLNNAFRSLGFSATTSNRVDATLPSYTITGTGTWQWVANDNVEI